MTERKEENLDTGKSRKDRNKSSYTLGGRRGKSSR
jgi:hypothetical protein